MMEHSNLSFRHLYKVMYLMTNTKKGVSALEMQRQLGFKRYEPVWYMMHKIRITMGNRVEKYQLEGLVEVDDAFVKVIKDDGSKKPGRGQGTRGRGSQTSNTIVVMTSAEKVSNPRKKRPGLFPKYVKIYQAENLKGGTIKEKLEPAIKSSSQIVTDGYRAYSKLGKMFRKHNQMIVPPTKAHILLPCVHPTIGNLKRYINGV